MGLKVSCARAYEGPHSPWPAKGDVLSFIDESEVEGMVGVS